MSFHTGQTFTFGETPSATKWNYLWENDYALADGTGIEDSVIGNRQLAVGVCVQLAYATYTAAATGTTQMALDDTLPQNTEGIEFMTCAITPKASTNVLVIRAQTHIASSIANNNLMSALFRDSGADALAWARNRSPTVAGAGESFSMEHVLVAGSTSATTFKVRAGGNGAGTTTFNGGSGARLSGATVKSSIVITEHKAS